MKFISIRFKLVALVVIAFAITIVAVLIVSDRRLSAMLDRTQNTQYAENVDRIWGALDRMQDRLRKTGLVETYTADFQRSIIDDLRKTYYADADERSYPVILDGRGRVILHPELPVNDLTYLDRGIFDKLHQADKGTATDTSSEPKKFYSYKRFKAWNWIIVYEVPLSVKYGASRSFRYTLALVMISIACVVTVILGILMARFTKPIVELTTLSSQIAEGNLDQQVKISGNDELAVLARCFEDMRLAVKNQITSLETEVTERERAERGIRLFKSALEASTDAIGMSTPDGRHYYQNDAFDELFGEIGDDPPASLYVDQDVGRKVFNAIMAGDVWIGEVQMYGRNREIRDLLLRAYAIKGEDGKILGLVGVHTDITDRKRSEEELKENQLKLSTLFATMTEMVVLHELVLDDQGQAIDYRITDCNAAYCSSTGITKDEAVGRLGSEVYGSQPAPYFEEFSRVALTGETYDFVTYYAPLKKHFVISVVCTGKNQFATVTTDVTDIKHAEEELRKNEENLRVTLDSIGDAVIATDTDGRVTRMNPVAETLTGWSIGEARNRELSEVFLIVHAETGEKMPNPIAKVLEKSDIVELTEETMLLSKDGKEYRIANSGAPIRTPDGDAIGVVLVFRDISEDYILQERLRHSQKMDAIGQLAGGVAHDFNNMLGGILGAAELLSDHLPNDDEAKLFHKLIVESAQRAAGLTQKLLSFARKRPPTSEVLNIHNAIQDTVDLLKGSLDRRIQIELDFASEECCVSGDIVQIQNAILNLGINASHAMPDGGVIKMSTRTVDLDSIYCENSNFDLEPGHYVELEVMDEGCGIASQNLPRIFEPFYTTRAPGEGTGLGLSAVYGTIRQHGGEIKVQSEVGVGTSFRLLIPQVDSASSVHEAPPQVDRGVGRILVVDDEEAMRITAKAMLEHLGYEVLLATDGEDGLAIFSQNPELIDLVVLDMVMPKMNGKDCFEAMKSIRPDIRVILASGFSREDDVADMKEGGIIGYIRKPYRTATFGRMIHDALSADGN